MHELLQFTEDDRSLNLICFICLEPRLANINILFLEKKNLPFHLFYLEILFSIKLGIFVSEVRLSALNLKDFSRFKEPPIIKLNLGKRGSIQEIVVPPLCQVGRKVAQGNPLTNLKVRPARS